MNRSHISKPSSQPIKPNKQHFLLLKVTLMGIRPPIWRRFVVPNTFTLAKLHHALQTVMGWEEAHPYEFHLGSGVDQCFLGNPDDSNIDDFEEDAQNATARNLTYLNKKGMKLIYVYDFGDSWEHEIIVEDADYDYSGEPLVAILEGNRNCPPEDCGGVYGYCEILEALKHPKNRDAKELLDWLGGKYNPEEFNLELRNKMLANEFKQKEKSGNKKKTSGEKKARGYWVFS
ncbi:MAG: plasmid pRiA4b ORF-3 family protein [Planctomycetaceae bacterium]|jgi:hypothetical protein|nr:plasmid pRiA4b ORF-3 family protein [Planctomycetaceae bacterium]